jgi:hypothetical protein
VTDIHAENADEDGFLYMIYSGENTFGWLFINAMMIIRVILNYQYCFLYLFVCVLR